MKNGLSCMVATIVTLLAVDPARATEPQGGSDSSGPGSGSLDAAEAATLAFTREEEKLARDTYTTLHKVWGNPIFERISWSEQSHMDAVLKLLLDYGLPDPAEGMDIGEFKDGDLQDLYDLLVGKGLKSRKDAMEVGVAIEVMDMDDLSDAIEEADNGDLDRVYGHLLEGSESHLVAFAAHLESL